MFAEIKFRNRIPIAIFRYLVNVKSEIENPKSEITKTLLFLQKYTYKWHFTGSGSLSKITMT